MSDSTGPQAPKSNIPSGEPKLEGWGEIATYLRREIRTVQRWEKTLGLPVHRLQVGKQGQVYAYRSELDKWLRERDPHFQDDDDPEDPPAPADPPKSETSVPDSASPSAKRRRRLLVPALLSICLIAIGWLATYLYFLFVAAPPNGPRLRSRGDATASIRLFVRPFSNNSGDTSQEDFARGLTSEQITEIARLDPDHLHVVALTSSMLFKDKSIAEIKKAFSVEYVLEGTISRDGNQVHINANLIQTQDETSVWGQPFDFDLKNVLSVQRDVAVAVANAIVPHIPSQSSHIPSEDLKAGTPRLAQIAPTAFDSYLRARRFWNRRDLANSMNAYAEAIAQSKNFALAHSGLATAITVAGQAPNDGLAAMVAGPRARAEAQQAIALDPRNSEAHCVLANIAAALDWDYSTAENEFRRAVALDPNNPTTHQWFGEYLMARSRIPQAKVETEIALDLDPYSPIFTTARAEVFYYSREYDESINQSKLTLDLSSDFLLAHFWLGSAYREKKMYTEAIHEFDVARKMVPDNPAVLMAYGHALAVSGDVNGARHVLASLTALSTHRHVPPIYFAGIYTGLGDSEKAISLLELAADERDDRVIFLAIEPMADPLRSNPRFQRLLARIHLP